MGNYNEERKFLSTLKSYNDLNRLIQQLDHFFLMQSDMVSISVIHILGHILRHLQTLKRDILIDFRAF